MKNRLLLLAPCGLHAFRDEYFRHGEGTWSYEDQDSWGSACTHGSLQSPIDLEDQEAEPSWTSPPFRLGDIYSFKRNIVDSDRPGSINLEMSPLGLGSWTSLGSIHTPHGLAPMSQFHFHFPSEHTVNGLHFDGELHLAHRGVNADGHKETYIIAIFLQRSVRFFQIHLSLNDN